MPAEHYIEYRVTLLGACVKQFLKKKAHASSRVSKLTRTQIPSSFTAKIAIHRMDDSGARGDVFPKEVRKSF
jgi:hypothetical protein